MVGQTLGHYRILERLGEGGMGVVFKALDTRLNRHVAIKLLPPELTADPERRLRFQREAQMAAALDHPSIATIHEVGEHEGSPYLVMQLVEGKTLRERIGHDPLPVREWLKIGLPIAEGLAHAHARRVIHRDLKPDNVLITGEHQVKILDFGLAKLLEPERAPAGATGDLHSRLETISRELSRAGKVFGTVAYMSPEQARGEVVDHRSDLFSFGIVLYQMASGRLPFRGRSEVETLHAIIAEEPRPLTQVAEGYPAEAERLVRKAMEKEPDRRYQDAADLAADLRNLQRDLDSGRVSTASGQVPAARGLPPPAEALDRGSRRWNPLGALGIAGAARRWTIVAAIVVVVLAAVFGYVRFRTERKTGEGTAGQQRASREQAREAASQRKMIVVLPFENLGAPEDEYFADGLTEEITGRLAAVRGLGVISRKSAMQYAKTDKKTRQIGDELGVEYVLEGTVRWARGAGGGSRVRITPELIRVSDDTHLWAEAYDRVVQDIFQVQSEIAEKVMEQLGVTLLEPERRAVGSKPTTNPEAYQAYLRGLHHLREPSNLESGFRLAVQMFQRAVELDPAFALAHAALSRTHSAMYHFGYDRTEQRLVMAKETVDRALELAPEAPEVHLAFGYYHYFGHKDYPRALEEFAIAEKGMPNNADLLEVIGYVRRRQGRFGEAVDNLSRALQLDPLEPRVALNLAETFRALRKYAEAERYFDQSVALAPDSVLLYPPKAENYYLWRGTTEEARATLEAMPRSEPQDAQQLWSWFWHEIFKRQFRKALDRLSSSPLELLEFQVGVIPKSLLAAQAHAFLGEPEQARSAYDSARTILEKLVRERPDDWRVHSSHGLALAGLGRTNEAVREGRRATELYPVSKDAYGGAYPIVTLALIYTMVGEYDAALDQVEYLLSIPSMISVRYLRLDPRWQALWNHPRFKKLEERFGQGEATSG